MSPVSGAVTIATMFGSAFDASAVSAVGASIDSMSSESGLQAAIALQDAHLSARSSRTEYSAMCVS